jgi:predicted nucleotidyltransferase
MAGPFEYYFTERLPQFEAQMEDDDIAAIQQGDLIGDIVDDSIKTIAAIDQLRELPVRNQDLVLDMARMMVLEANQLVDSGEANWKANFWGLYVIGSRARDEARPDSDLDLLSVGTFYHNLGFVNADPYFRTANTPFEGFDIEVPDELPDEYNVGDVDRKYLVRATPQEEGVLPVDLSVVDLTFVRATLGDFKVSMDMDEGKPLPRVPLVELTVAERPMIWRP